MPISSSITKVLTHQTAGEFAVRSAKAVMFVRKSSATLPERFHLLVDLRRDPVFFGLELKELR